MKKYDFVCDFDLDDCLKTLGLDEGGKVQQAVDDTFITGVKPFTPWDEGDLYSSATEKTVVGSGEIVFDPDAKKARRLYYHPEYNFRDKGDSETGGIGRGAYWAERYIQNGGKEQIEQAARKAVKGK